MPSGVVPHHQPCLLVCCLTIGHAFWRGASLSTMPIGVLPHYRSCLLVWCLIINHACGVVPHYRQCLLAWYLTIGHAFWTIATAINILLVSADGKRVVTSLVLPVQRCHYIRHALRSVATLRYACLYNATIIRHACWVHEFIYACL